METRAAASGSRVLLEDPNHQPEFVAQGVRANAKSIEHAVDGIKKAVDSVKLEMATQKGPADDAPQLKSAPPEHDKLQTLSSSEVSCICTAVDALDARCPSPLLSLSAHAHSR